MIPEVFSTFPNMYELEYQNSNLQRIEVPATADLETLNLFGNNITRIARGDIRNQSVLIIFDAYNNNIQEIEDGAFDEMPFVFLAVFTQNNISQITNNTFGGWTYTFYLDLEANSLTRLDDGLFGHIVFLQVLYFEGNQINAISPRFGDSLPRFLEFIDFTGNQCVDRPFRFGDIDAIPSLNNGLHNCYNNFNGTSPGNRRITLEFQGNLSLFDQFGNLIFRATE